MNAIEKGGPHVLQVAIASWCANSHVSPKKVTQLSIRKLGIWPAWGLSLQCRYMLSRIIQCKQAPYIAILNKLGKRTPTHVTHGHKTFQLLYKHMGDTAQVH